MLTGTQTCYSKNEDKSIKYHLVVPAVFLDFGSGDAVEELTNSVKDEKAKTTSDKKYTQPVTSKVIDGKQVEVVSLESPDDLFSEAVDYVQGKFPESNPILKILHWATSGLNAELKEAARPAKEVSEVEAIAKIAKDLMKGMAGLSLEMATTLATSAFRAGQAALKAAA